MPHKQTLDTIRDKLALLVTHLPHLQADIAAGFYEDAAGLADSIAYDAAKLRDALSEADDEAADERRWKQEAADRAPAWIPTGTVPL
jgi:hypothetical protein